MAWYLCTIGAKQPGNWDIAKAHGIWGIPASPFGRRIRATIGDDLLFWLGGKGFIARGIVTGPPVTPLSKQEAPWPGSHYRFRVVIPMKVVLEAPQPVRFRFEGFIQEETGLNKNMFLGGFTEMPSAAAEMVVAKLRDASEPNGIVG